MNFVFLWVMEVWTQWVPCKLNVTPEDESMNAMGATYFGHHLLCTCPIVFICPWPSEIWNLFLKYIGHSCEMWGANSICVNLYWAIDTFLERPDTCPWLTFFNERLACKEDGKLINVKERKRKDNNGQHMIFRKTMTGYPRSVTMKDRRPPLTQGDREVKTWNHKALHTSRQPAQR